MTEQEFLEQIEYCESAMNIARHKIKEAKKMLNDGESELIELKIQRDRLVESLESFRQSSPTAEVMEVWDIDLERFRQAYPELCAMAHERDNNKRG